MPITNNASYIPTINEFIAHWTQVDAALGVALVVVKPDKSSIDQVNFINLRDALQTQEQNVIGFLNDQEIARGDITLKKQQMLGWMNEFNAMLDGYWAGTPFLNARANVPTLTDGQEVFLTPMRDVATLWTKLNAAPDPAGLTLPLVLSDGTAQADFAAALTALQTAYATLKDAEQNTTLARAVREQTKDSAYATMKAYRVIVPARCAQHPTLVSTLPKLTAEPGHTPQPVNASAVFQAPDQSKVVYDASDDAALARYELRGNPGDTYNDNDAVTILSHTPADPREFLTNFGLTQPGTQVALKVFVVLTTGNEAGSAVMVVERTS